jgi:hypothetical protein
MAMGLIDLFKSDDQTGSNEDTSSISSASYKRRRPDSVVTVPAKKRPGGNAHTPAMAEWVTGRRDPVEATAIRHGDLDVPLRGRKHHRGGVGGKPGAGALEEAEGVETSSNGPHK